MSTISMNCRRAASFADAQRLSRLRRTHGVFSRLRRTHGVFSRLRRSLRKRTARSLFSAPYRKALQRQAKIFIQAKITVPPHVRNRRIKHSKALTLGIPRVGALPLSGRILPFHFKLANGYRAVLHWTCNVLRGRTASFTPTAATTEANRNYGVFRSAGETLRKQSDIGRTASFRAYGVP